jgi:hypothetical protein
MSGATTICGGTASRYLNALSAPVVGDGWWVLVALQPNMPYICPYSFLGNALTQTERPAW